MIIRKTKESDLQAVEKLFKLPELEMPNGENLSADQLTHYIDGKYFLLAEENSKIVGAILGEELKNQGILILLFAISEDDRGKGIGTALLNEFEKIMICEEKKWVILYAPANSIKTINFYEKHGFTKGKLHVEFEKIFE